MADASVTIANTPEAVEALREVWSGLAVKDIDSELDYFLTVAANAKQVLSPYVVHVRRGAQPDLLVVARLENLPVPLKVAYWNLGSARLKAIVVTFKGVLGTCGRDDEALVMTELHRLLDQGAADVLLMRNVDIPGSLHAAVVGSVAGLRLARAQPVDRLWTIPLPASLDMFLADRSAKSRRSFRKEDRVLHEKFGDRLRLRRFRRPEEIDELCRDMERVSARTYQRGLGAGFSNSQMDRALIAHGLAKGSYRCWMLYAQERPVAFWAGFAHGCTFFAVTPGFDPDYAKLSIGRYTMFRMIEDLCEDPSISQVDFGRGDAQYKEEYATVSGQATDVWLAARRVWPILVINALSVSSMVNRQGKSWIVRFNATHRIRTILRRRLRKSPHSTEPA